MDLFVIGSWRFAGGHTNCDVRYSSSCSILIGFIVTVAAPETTEFPVNIVVVAVVVVVTDAVVVVVVASAAQLTVVVDTLASAIVKLGSETQWVW